MRMRGFWRLALALGIVLAWVVRADAVWLEGVRWFKHDTFVRVVFDLSAPTQYRISERLQDGYVDLVLQGELNRRMAEEIAIGEGGVLGARQLRRTSTSLTWRVQVEGMGRVKHMALEETPYKIAIDFYPAGGRTAAKVKNPPPADGKKAGEPRMAAQVKHPAPAAESAKPAASKPQPGKDKAAPAKAQQGKDKAAALKPAPAKDAKAPGQDAARRAQEEKTAAQAKAQAQARATAEAKAAEQAKAVAQAKAAEEAAAASKALPSEEQRLNGLGAEDRRRLQVGELLMQLGDSSGAMPYLEKVAEHKPEHAWTRILLAQLFLAKGDEYRARHLLESLQASSQWKNTVQPILARMSPPDAHGVVPGGEMPEEDLSFYLGVLRQGGGLKAQDLYREPEELAPTPAKGSFLSGIFVGALLGLVAFAGAEWRRRKQMDRLVRERILGESSAPSSPEVPFGRSAADMTEVSRRVREELEQVMQAERTEGGASGGRAAEPSFAAVFEAASNAPDPDSLEERIYRLSDQRKSIVEIAEELNLGVDEVRLHLSLREQSGQMTNG